MRQHTDQTYDVSYMKIPTNQTTNSNTKQYKTLRTNTTSFLMWKFPPHKILKHASKRLTYATKYKNKYENIQTRIYVFVFEQQTTTHTNQFSQMQAEH
jgi:hypothetical protein